MTGGSVAAVADGHSLDSVPCIVPLLPLVVGTAGAAHRAGPLLLAAGVALSFATIGLFVATVGFTIGSDVDIFGTAAAVLLMVIGLVLLSGSLQARFAQALGGVSNAGN
jgi:cytochrome c-type biogenesis protein